MKTKVLILHTAVGYGIKITAENIKEKLDKSGLYETRIEDVGKVETGWFGKFWQSVYALLLERFSFIWGFLYNSNFILFLILPFRKSLASFNSKKVLKILREFQPAMVISTQVMPSGIMAYLKTKGFYRGKIVIVFSDYHLHRFWLFEEADLYLCNIVSQAVQLRALGVPPEKITVTGMVIGDKFYDPINPEDAAREFGLLTSMPTVLVSSGGKARMSTKEIFLKLLRSQKTFQLAVVCGRNEELKKELETIAPPDRHPVKIFGYVDRMQVLMSACNLLVGKTGGPTMAEAVIKRLPIIITDARPGHELINLTFLLNNNVVDYGRIPREVVFIVEQLLEGKIKRNWPELDRIILKPDGAKTVIEALETIKPQPLGLNVRNYQE